MKVIYAGFSKCATKSMAKALRLLGMKVYDFMENYEHLASDWMKIYRDGATVERLRKMYDGVDAVTGMPVYYYWEELLEAFPEAKVSFILFVIIFGYSFGSYAFYFINLSLSSLLLRVKKKPVNHY